MAWYLQALVGPPPISPHTSAMILLQPIVYNILSNKNTNKIPNFKVFERTECEDVCEMSDLSIPHSCFDRFLWVNESPIDHSKTILRNKGAAKLFSQRMPLLSDEPWWAGAIPRKVQELQMGSLHPPPFPVTTQGRVFMRYDGRYKFLISFICSETWFWERKPEM